MPKLLFVIIPLLFSRSNLPLSSRNLASLSLSIGFEEARLAPFRRPELPIEEPLDLNRVFPDPSCELPKIDDGGGSAGVKDPTEEGGGPAGVVEGFGAKEVFTESCRGFGKKGLDGLPD